MLEKLICEIRAGGTLETGNLADRLGTTPQLVAAMLEHLQRGGMVQAYTNGTDGCVGCSLQGTCRKADRDSIRLWQSTSPG